MRPLNSETFPLTGQQLIEASAGTGKTYTITNLYLRLILGRDPNQTRPLLTSEILVLTFTIAATDELRQRIRDRVIAARKLFAGDDSETDDFLIQLKHQSRDIDADRKLLSFAIQTMDEAAIFTIHGFCARVLGEQSFETGMLFDQDLDGDKDLLLQMATEDCFRKLILTLPDLERDIALGQWRTPAVLQKQAKGFLFRHNLTLLPPENDVREAIEKLQEKIQRCKAMWLEAEITELLRSSDLHKGRKAITRLDDVIPHCESDSLDIDFWEPWTSAGLENAKKKNSALPEHEIFSLIDEIWAGKALFEQLKTNLWHQVSSQIKTSLLQYKQQFGQLTLDDLLAEVHTALHAEGSQLESTLRRRWPVAMIDEFQDTDDLQYEIFARIYPPSSSCGLFLIGDPKQAIYQFRGADVFTYINAKRKIESDAYSLDTNWRSTPALIEAVNHLFTRQDIFGNDADIPFQPVASAPKNADRSLICNEEIQKPFHIFVNNRNDKKAFLRTDCMEYAAEQTAQLLNLAAAGKALIDGEPISAGQIAFLVRERQDGDAARLALARRNIRSVYVTLESVFLSETANDLKLILQAVTEPTSEKLIKSALATTLMQTSITEIDRLNHDWPLLQQTMQEFQDYHDQWESIGIAAMVENLMVNRQLAEKWFRKPEGERIITNLRHLAELLQQQSLVAPGMHKLIKWFSREQQDAATVGVEEQQLRLESDQHLVKIVTMHASKGLEYDVVMIPMAGFGEPRNDSMEPVLFHQPDANGNLAAYLDLAAEDKHKAIKREEELNEYMRLLYVAITRAKYICYLGVPLFKKIEQTALARLLEFEAITTDDIVEHLNKLPDDLFNVSEVEESPTTVYRPPADQTKLTEPPIRPSVQSNWRIHSYTGLTRLLNKIEPAFSNPDVEPGFADDDPVAAAIIDEGESFTRFTFPRGPRIGIALHDLMENLDFSAPESDVADWCRRCINKMGITENVERWQSVLISWFYDMVNTPLNDAAAFTLADIDQPHRLNEMEFHFPLTANQAFLDAVRKAGYLDDSLTLSISSMQGMMTGYIDLIVEHDGKYFLMDYKSNDLGPTQSDYDPPHLHHAIKHHHYDLQYLIYCVALNRYLQHRLPGYKYEQHFGGVCYLFMRGMDRSPGSGTFFDRPSEALITALDKLLSTHAVEPVTIGGNQ